MTLYLQYRPQSFADVVGQDHIVSTLEQAVSRGRISHAYLFCGSRGTGKTSVARILAKTILSQGIDDAKLRVHIEKAIEDGSLVDFIEIDAASNRRIDDIRDLIEKIGFSPAVTRAKVYIIDEVHMLTKEAFNALLKTLEEPPEYAYFILATTELHKVPETIQSRCQRFLFRRVKDDDVIRRLQYIADRERINVERDALREIARSASGSFRDGIALLDQLRSLEKITVSDVSERVGKSAMHFVDDVLEKVRARDGSGILATVSDIEGSNMPMDLIATELLSAIRTDLHSKIQGGEDASTCIAMVDVLLEALKNMRLSPVPVLVLESALLEMAGIMGSGTPIHEPPKKRLEVKQEEQRDPPKKSAKAERAPADEQSRPTLIKALELTPENVLRHWEEILKGTSPPSAKMSLKNASVSAATEGIVTLSFPSAFHKEKVSDTKASRSIEAVMEKLFHQPIRIRCILEEHSKAVGGERDTDLAAAAKEVFGSL